MSAHAKTVLLTGATGLVGREFRRQASPQQDIWALSRDGGGAGRERWIRHDLTQPPLPDGLPGSVDAVVHLAQSPHFRDFPERALHVFEVNVGSTARLLDWALRAGARRFIYASSGGIYGRGSREFREEDTIARQSPLGPYLASKQCGELQVENYAGEMTVVILRFFFVYGRHQREDMLIPRLIGSVRDGRPIRLQGEDGLVINPIHVSDAARAVHESLSLVESQKINVAGPAALSLREVGETIGAVVGREPVFEVDISAPGDRLVGDIEKMRRVLGPPRVPFERGIREMVG